MQEDLMGYIDLHCDYLYKLYKSLYFKNEKVVFQTDIAKLIQGNCISQVFAILFNRYETKTLGEYYKCIIRLFDDFIISNSDKIAKATSYNDIINNLNANKISAILSLEDSQFLCESGDNIEKLYNDGVRIAGLLWDGENDIGYSYKENKPLKKQGVEAIRNMEDANIIIDVSHLSDEGFLDVARYTKKPFIASHSNARKLTNHRRNLTDEQIKIMADRGGIIGINSFPKYIDLVQINENSNSKIEYLIAHIKHIVKIGGEDCIALGFDFDGMPNEVLDALEIKSANHMGNFYEALTSSFGENVTEKIFKSNALRFFKDNLK